MVQETRPQGTDRYQLNGASVGLLLGLVGGAVFAGFGGAIAGGVAGLFFGGIIATGLARLKGPVARIVVGLIVAIFAILVAQSLFSNLTGSFQADEPAQIQNAGSYKSQHPDRRD
jgi:hypothetical protein